jgi:hypothetical protein
VVTLSFMDCDFKLHWKILVATFQFSLSFQLRCTHSFRLFTILDLSIASGLFSMSFGILFHELNSKVDLMNWMILICFDTVASFFAFWLVKLLNKNN